VKRPRERVSGSILFPVRPRSDQMEAAEGRASGAPMEPPYLRRPTLINGAVRPSV
jgi:hypothetical protein